MSLKRTFTTFLAFMLIILSSQVFAIEDDDLDTVDRSKIFEKAFTEWIETYKNESVPEEERITDYLLNGCSFEQNNVKKIKVALQFEVTPASENSIWRDKGRNMCFLEMTNTDGEYKVDYISHIPQNYDKFLERFEEYKLTAQSKEAEDNKFQEQQTIASVSNQKIEQIRNMLIISCAVALVLVIAVIIIRFLKMKSIKHEINNI